jgi:hypothetical protein
VTEARVFVCSAFPAINASLASFQQCLWFCPIANQFLIRRLFSIHSTARSGHFFGVGLSPNWQCGIDDSEISQIAMPLLIVMQP